MASIPSREAAKARISRIFSHVFPKNTRSRQSSTMMRPVVGVAEPASGGLMSDGVALVVGAGAATGSAVARAFASEGYHVCAVRRNGNKLVELVKSIRESGGVITPFGVDCRKEEEVIRLIEEVEAKIGPIKVCVHNIGANVRFSILETTSRVYRKVWEMAAFSAFLVTREVAKKMVKRKEGTILITGATASTRGASHFSAFAGAKHAKRALAQSAARELMPKGIHVCHVIVDGAIDTPWTTKLFGDKTMKEMRKKNAVLKPDSIAKLYVMLSNQDKSAWTHEIDLRPWNEKW